MPVVARAVPPPNTFSNGTVADANLVNANFSAVSTLAFNGVRISVGATKYCGNTAAVYTGAMGGYAGAKKHCETVASCGLSPTAHVCSVEEYTRSAQLGLVPVGTGWLTGIGNDCVSFTSGSSGTGSIWDQGTGSVSGDTCGASHFILCCD
jgi:hypothetical protein